MDTSAVAARTLPLKLSPRTSSTATLTATLTTGEKVKGAIRMISLGHPDQDQPIAGTAEKIPPPLAQQWDEIYGQGAYVANVLGQGHDARGTLTGTQGTVLQVEIHAKEPWFSLDHDRISEDRVPKGVVVDEKGNLYKVAF